MSARLVPGIRQRLIELRNLLDRAKANGEDTQELVHVLKTLVLLNVDFGRESLSGLLALAADAARTLEHDNPPDDEAHMVFERLDRWFSEAAIVMASLRASRDV